MNVFITKFEAYLLTEKRVAYNTFSAYKRDVAQFIDYLNKNALSLEQATIEHIKKFLQHLHEQNMTARSMARKISSLKTFYSYLHDHHKFEHHARDLVIPKIEKKLPQYLSEEDVERLLTTTEQDKSDIGVRNKVMVYLLYVSGMRISELVSITKGAIQFDTGFLAVNGKGGRARTVPLPTNMLEMLKDYIENVHPQLLMRDSNKLETDYLFPIFYGQKIKHITRQAFWVILKKFADTIGLRDYISPHKLRHSLATHLLRKGADLRSLQLLLGHEQLSTIQIYTHLDTDHLRKEYDKKHPRS
jgi:integrase/recombinase XerD